MDNIVGSNNKLIRYLFLTECILLIDSGSIEENWLYMKASVKFLAAKSRIITSPNSISYTHSRQRGPIFCSWSNRDLFIIVQGLVTLQDIHFSSLLSWSWATIFKKLLIVLIYNYLTLYFILVRYTMEVNISMLSTFNLSSN